MDFKPDFKVHNLVSVHPKSIIHVLGQMTNLNMIFHVVGSVLISDWLKFQTRPSSLMNFQNGQFACLSETDFTMSKFSKTLFQHSNF